MKGGRVVKVRVMPQDCMAAVDVLRNSQTITTGMSFAQVVSTAFHQLLNLAREKGIVPGRDGFEYAEMMEPFQDQPSMKNRGRKLQITQTYEHARMGVEPAESPFVQRELLESDRIESELIALNARERADLDSQGNPMQDYSEERAQLLERHKAALEKEKTEGLR